jgi:hypothetical protein
MAAVAVGATMRTVKTFLLSHSHAESECAAAFAAWSGVASPLRGETAIAGCAHGDHRIFWRVDAADAQTALSMLPEFVAHRTVATPVRDVLIP